MLEKDNLRRTPFHWAVINGEEALVKKMIAHGVPIDEADVMGFTPLYFSIAHGHTNIANVLRLNGAGVKRTPFHLAVMRGDEALVRQMLATGEGVGVDIDEPDSEGTSAL